MKIFSSNIINGILDENFGQNAIASYKQNGTPVVNFDIEWKLYNQNSHYLHLLFIDYDSIPVCGMPFIHWTVANIDLYKIKKININDALNNKDLIQGTNSLPFYDPEKTNKQFYTSYVGPMPPDKDHTYTLIAWTTFEPINVKPGFTFNELYKQLTEDKVVEHTKLDFLYHKDKVIVEKEEQIVQPKENSENIESQNADVNKNQKKNYNFFKSPKTLNYLLFSSLFLSLIWLTMILLIPITFPFNQTGYLSHIYFKQTSTAAASLTACGCATIVFLCFFIAIDITCLVFIIIRKQKLYDNKKLNISYYTSVGLLALINLIGILLVFSPVTSYNNSTFYNFYLQSYNQELSYNFIWYLFIVFFALIIAFAVINVLVCNKIAVFENFNLKEFIKNQKEHLATWYKELRANSNKRKENKIKKKRLLDEEQKLLQNLEEVDLSTTQSEEELEKNIKLNNDIKNRINEIQEETDKIKQENSFGLFKKNNSPKQSMNKRSNRVKKQQIAVPDKELEEIFKNLDIDD